MHAGITVEMNKVIYHFILEERKKEEAFIRSSFVILDTGELHPIRCLASVLCIHLRTLCDRKSRSPFGFPSPRL